MDHLVARKLIEGTPTPLAELVARALNAPPGRDRHDAVFYLGEATLKLAASLRIGRWLDARLDPSSPIARQIEAVVFPSLGHWCSFLREISAALVDDALFPDERELQKAKAPALGAFADKLAEWQLADKDAIANVRRRGVIGFFEGLVVYRNAVLGHGAQRSPTFYEDASEVIFAALAEVLRTPALFSELRLAFPHLTVDSAGTRTRATWRELEGMVAFPLNDDASDARAGELYFRGERGKVSVHPFVIRVLLDRDGARFAFLNRAVERKDRVHRADYLDYLTSEVVASIDATTTLTGVLGRLRNATVDAAVVKQLTQTIAMSPATELAAPLLQNLPLPQPTQYAEPAPVKREAAATVAASNPSLPKSLLRLVATGGPLASRILSFDTTDLFVFGRDPSLHEQTQLPESDPTASRFHFVLEVSPPHGRLRDLGSLNGTQVNGQKLGGRAPNETPEQARLKNQQALDLKHGDVITAGNHAFRVEQVRVEAPAIALAPTELPVPPAGGVPTTPTPALPPASPDAFERLKRLGEGGVGEVWLVRHRQSGGLAAMKVMLPQTPSSPEMAAMFVREMRVQGRYVHDNLVRLYDAGAGPGGVFAVMEYCPGGSAEDLRERAGGRVGVDVALPLIIAATRGVAFLHGQGVIHRDLKPENILLANESPSSAKVADFGLAKSLQESVGFSSKTGFAAGTPAFMPREQLVNYKRAGKAADVFALAACMYVLLTGRAPRPSSPNEHPMLQITRDTIPLATVLPGLPTSLSSLVDRALQMDPARRPPDASALLGEWLALATR